MFLDGAMALEEAMVGDIDTAWSLSERRLSDVVWFPCNTSSEDVRMEAGTRDNEEYRQISLSWRGKLQYMMRSWTGSVRVVEKKIEIENLQDNQI